MTFDGSSLSITASGNLKDNWLLELSRDPKAKLPFEKIGAKKLACTFRNTPYSLSPTRGSFASTANSGLQVLPAENRIVLDFSSR